MKIYNSLSRKVEEFVPISKGKVGVYACGPTVYSYVHIGNWRSYVLGDLLVRSLSYLGYSVDYVMNITDVGHLVSDADEGEDKLEKGARRDGKTAWEVAKFYGDDFLQGFGKLNLVKPSVFCKATEHIADQIELIRKIEKKGFVYKIDDGVYFDVVGYEKAGFVYGELSDLDKIKAGARVELNKQKKDPRDFALWKFSPSGQKRDMEWDSPWGRGFPGWHIECSAMSMKYLGERFDIHLGGEDLRSTHHPNEIAQSESASGKKPFVKYWMHGAFLRVDGGKMSKSLGNVYNLHDLEKRGFSALDLRYFFLTGHYRKALNFTWEALESSRQALAKLRKITASYVGEGENRGNLSSEKLARIDKFRSEFVEAIESDLSMPLALAVVWRVVKSNVSDYDKFDLLRSFDEILGLGLSDVSVKVSELSIPVSIQRMLDERTRLRSDGRYAEADKLREKIKEKGFVLKDIDGSKTKIVKRDKKWLAR